MHIRKDINAREESLLNLLWEKNVPLTSNEMIEILEPEGWKQITLLKTIQSLSDKGYLKVVGLEKTVKTYARRFVPAMTKGAFYSKLIIDKGLDRKSIIDITAALIGVDGDSKEGADQIIETLESIIEEYKNERRDTQ